jgi:hypothetical protein
MERKTEYKKGVITSAVPATSWLYPYIGTEVLYNEDVIILGDKEYENEKYDKNYLIIEGGYLDQKQDQLLRELGSLNTQIHEVQLQQDLLYLLW